MANPNLAPSAMLPGFYGYVDYSAATSASAPNNRVLLWGYVTSSATATPNQPFLPSGASDLAGKAGSPSSDLARAYNASIAAPEAAGAEVWCMAITPPSGGVAATYALTVYIPGGSNPTKPGTFQLWIASQQLPAVGFSTTDTASTIAANIATAITSVCGSSGVVPLATATASGAVVTLTYPHKGTTGEDLPLRGTVTPDGSGVYVSPGQALFATSATGAGSVIVTAGGVSVTTALSGGETAAQVATKVAASWNASSYPLTAAVDGSTPAQVDFYLNPGYDVRRMSATVVTTTGTTVNLGSGATSGAGLPTSLTYNGTQGTGLPSLTSAITNLTARQDWWRSWMSPWSDATTLGTLATYIEAGSNGSITGQKLQVLTTGDWEAISVAGAIPPAVSPNLTTTPPHYAVGWAPDTSVQVFELSARVATARAALWIGNPQKNWNGYRLQGTASAPILKPKISQDLLTLNTALRTYAMAPWVPGSSGNVEIVKGRTTSLSQDLRLWSWSCEAQASYHIQDLAAYFAATLRAPDGGAANLIRFTTPKAPGLYDAQSVVDLTTKRMLFWERQGNYDGAVLLAPLVTASVNVSNPNRVDVDFPESPVLDLDQVVFTGHFMQPSV